MSEDQKSSADYGLREDLEPLVGGQVVAHVAKHTAAVEQAKLTKEKTERQAARQEKWQELATKVNHLAEVERGTKEVGPYAIQTLDVGAKLGAIARAGGDGGLFAAADNLAHSESLARMYIEGGPISGEWLNGHMFEDSEDLVSTADEYVRGLFASGVSLSLTLESSEEIQEGYPPIQTKGEEFVGTVLDPETILVPSDSQSPLIYRVIGPDNHRFEPIMNLLGEVNQLHGEAGHVAV
ncbi:MAG TPA: hypothetical protein VIJ68_00375 [Candidatus Saccharimonadales bacterium]